MCISLYIEVKGITDAPKSFGVNRTEARTLGRPRHKTPQAGGGFSRAMGFQNTSVGTAAAV